MRGLLLPGDAWIDSQCAIQLRFLFRITPDGSVTKSDLEERDNVTRVELNCPLEVTNGLLPAPLKPLDGSHHLEYAVDHLASSGVQLPVQPERRRNRGKQHKEQLARGVFHLHPDEAESGLNSCFLQCQPPGSMVAKQVKMVVSRGELAIRLEKRWIACHSLIQQIDCLQPIRFRRATERRRQKEIVGTRVKIERDEVGGWLALNGQFLSSCDFGVQSFGDSLRNLALDGEQIIQITVVLLGPNVRVGARVDQLRIQVNPITAPACASFQHVRYAKRIADLAHISFTAIFHHAGPADHFEIGDLRQLGQNVVLHTIGEDGVFFLVV